MKSHIARFSTITGRIIVACVFLVLAGCTGAAPSTGPAGAPGATSEATGVAPRITLVPSSQEAITVVPGDRKPLAAKVTGAAPVSITWKASCLRNTDAESCSKVLSKTEGEDIFFTAPNTPGEMVTVRATVADRYGSDFATVTFQIKEAALTAPATTEVTATASPSATSSPPQITALEPKPDMCSPAAACIIVVTGGWAPEGKRNQLQLYILVRPLPDNPSQAYWVQAVPEVDPTGSWKASDVYIGQPGDAPGMPLKICVLATSQSLKPGQSFATPPAGPMSCLDIARGKVGASAAGPASTPTLPAVLPLAPQIASFTPKPEDCSPGGPCIVRLEGLWVPESERKGLLLNVLVRPEPNNPRQSYWVQAAPMVQPDGHWYADSVNIGQPGDEAGLPFKVCVIAASQALVAGQPMGTPPQGPMACTNVTRGRR